MQENRSEFKDGVGKSSGGLERLGHNVPKDLTLFSTDSADIAGMFELGWHEEVLNLSVEKKGNIPVSAEFAVLGTLVEPAVLSESQVAARSLDEEHPSINDGTVSLKAESHQPSENMERKEGNVDQPDEETSAELAPEEKSKPDPVKKPISNSNSYHESPPWKSHHANNMQFPNG